MYVYIRHMWLVTLQIGSLQRFVDSPPHIMNINILEKAAGAHLSRNVTKELNNLFIIRGGWEKTLLLSALTRDLDAMPPFTSCQLLMSEESKKQCKDQGSMHQWLCHIFFQFECQPSSTKLASSYPTAQSSRSKSGSNLLILLKAGPTQNRLANILFDLTGTAQVDWDPDGH